MSVTRMPVRLHISRIIHLNVTEYLLMLSEAWLCCNTLYVRTSTFWMTSFVINQFGHGDTCRAFSESDLSGAVGSTKPGVDQSMSTFFSFLIEIYYLNVIDVQTGNATIFFHKDSPAIWFLCT